MMIKRYKSKIIVCSVFAVCVLLLITVLVHFLPDNISSAAETTLDENTTRTSKTEENAPVLSANETVEEMIEKIVEKELICINRSFVENIAVIEAEFGPDAWEDVIYKEIQTPPLILRTGYILCATGEEITEADYERILDEHITEVCRKNDYDRNLIDMTGDEVSKMTQEEMNKYLEITDEITKTCPVKLAGIPDGESKRFSLEFSGKSSSGETGICDVVIDLVKIDGTWKFHAILYSTVTVHGEEV